MKKIMGGFGFCPQIVSSPGGGSLRVCLVKGNIPQSQSPHHNHAQTPSKNSTDDVNGDDIDTTLRLSFNYTGTPVPPVNVNVKVNVLRNPLLGSLDGDDDDEVDTSLTLSPPGSLSSTKKSTITTMPKPRNGRFDQFQEVDAATPGSLMSDRVYNPRPLRWYFPGVGFWTAHDPNQADKVTSNPDPSTLGTINEKKRKRRRRDVDGGEQRPPRRRRNAENNQRPLVPIEEIPGLIQTIQLRGGSGPVFLYRKKLEMSDVDKGQNRLFVTRGERVMEFLTEEEAAEVNRRGKGGIGIQIVGVDGGGVVYEKIGLKRWATLNMIVIKSEWRRVVARNNAEAGDVVEIWGYRDNHKPCLAFNFRKERRGDDIV